MFLSSGHLAGSGHTLQAWAQASIPQVCKLPNGLKANTCSFCSLEVIGVSIPQPCFSSLSNPSESSNAISGDSQSIPHLLFWSLFYSELKHNHSHPARFAYIQGLTSQYLQSHRENLLPSDYLLKHSSLQKIMGTW